MTDRGPKHRAWKHRAWKHRAWKHRGPRHRRSRPGPRMGRMRRCPGGQRHGRRRRMRGFPGPPVQPPPPRGHRRPRPSRPPGRGSAAGLPGRREGARRPQAQEHRQDDRVPPGPAGGPLSACRHRENRTREYFLPTLPRESPTRVQTARNKQTGLDKPVIGHEIPHRPRGRAGTSESAVEADQVAAGAVEPATGPVTEKPIARWKAMEPELTGAVTADTAVRPSARASAKNPAYSSWARPWRAPRATPAKWM